MHKKTTTRLVAALFLTAVVAGCGSDDDGTAATNPPQTTAAGAPTQSTAPPPTATVAPAATSISSICPTPGTCEPSASLIAAAKAEGQLTSYAVIDAALQGRMATAFKNKYGIDVTFAQLAVAQVIERANAERQSGRFTVDVIAHSNDTAHSDFQKDKGYMPLSPNEIPNLLAVSNDPDWFKKDYAFAGGPAWGLGWNTGKVQAADVPKTWCELSDPKWKGQFGLVDQVGATSVYLTFKLMEDLCGPTFLTSLKDNSPRFYENTTTLLTAVTAGEVSLAVTTVHSIINQKAKSAPVDGKPMNGMSIGARWVGITSGAPHPNAAKLFVNWMYSQEAQELMYGNSQGMSVLPASLVPDAIEQQPLTVLAVAADLPNAAVQAIRTKLGRG